MSYTVAQSFFVGFCMDQVTLAIPVLGVVAFIFTGIIAAITFFLKREINRNDALAAEVKCIKETYASQDDLEKTAEGTVNQLGKMEERFTTRLDRIDGEISTIRQNYITSETFVREIGKLTAQNDRIYGILLDLTRERK